MWNQYKLTCARGKDQGWLGGGSLRWRNRCRAQIALGGGVRRTVKSCSLFQDCGWLLWWWKGVAASVGSSKTVIAHAIEIQATSRSCWCNFQACTQGWYQCLIFSIIDDATKMHVPIFLCPWLQKRRRHMTLFLSTSRRLLVSRICNSVIYITTIRNS